MGWEMRKGGRYYYQSVRVNGRVAKVYHGRGLVAESAERLAQVRADKRRRAGLDRWLDDLNRPVDGRVNRLMDGADAVLAVWLPAVGLHRPKRGPWRRKRGTMNTIMPATLAERLPLEDWNADALRARIGPLPAAVAGEKPKAKAVAAFLADNPAAVALYGDLARRAVQKLAAGCEGKIAATAIMTRADAMRRALAGDHPTAVELLLAERVTVCWVACQQYELAYYHQMTDESLSVKSHLFCEKRIDAAHRRLLSALKTLAVVRRLRLPDLMAVVRVDAADAPRLSSAEG